MPKSTKASESKVQRSKKPHLQRRRDKRRQAVKDGDPAGAIIADVQRLEAIRLKIGGHSYPSIAQRLSISTSTAYKYVNDGWAQLDDVTDDTRKKLRAIEEDRLDAAVRIIMPVLDEGVKYMAARIIDGTVVLEQPLMMQLKAIDRLVRVSKRRSELRGLDQNPTEAKPIEKDERFMPMSELARVIADQQSQLGDGPASKS